MNDILAKLKENGEDFEWYPTTREMVLAIKRYIPQDVSSLMDIGAGDGRVLEWLAENCKDPLLYGIEKSAILMEQWPKDIIPVGTDVHEQNLSALQVDFIISNPPYSEFSEWTRKIVSEGYAKKAYLVIPERWKDDTLIKDSIDARGAHTRVIWNGDFLKAERQARAKVNIVEVSFPMKEDGYHDKVKDPFNIWFDQNIDTFDKAKEEKPEETSDALARRYANASIDEMVAAYREEYDRLEANYRMIFKLDYAILKELGVDKKAVRGGLKAKMAGLKVKYWQILFDRLDAITSRLTTKSRKKLIEKLTHNTSVEFTVTNAYSVVLWAIKNANQYFDEQLVDVFRSLSTHEGTMDYKSNEKTWGKNGWRYMKYSNYEAFSTEHYGGPKAHHYKLDYRIVVNKYHGIYKKGDWNFSEYQYPGGLHENCHELLADVIAVMSNLEFPTYSPHPKNRKWIGGRWQNWIDDGPNCTDEDILFQVKAYINGNFHFRFKPEAIMALNINAARILKWVKNEEECVEELGYTREEVHKYFNHNVQITANNVPLLTAPEPEPIVEQIVTIEIPESSVIEELPKPVETNSSMSFTEALRQGKLFD